MSPTFRLRRPLATVAVVLLAGVGCSGPAIEGDREGPLPRQGGDPPRAIVLVSIDTLRSDHLPAYGYTEGSTPALDVFRREAVLFERAYSPYPLTLPAHASLFTGLRPENHGVRNNLGYALKPEASTLAGLLQSNGWVTGGFVSASVLSAHSGIASGFGTWDADFEGAAGAGLGASQRSGAETLERALRWLDGLAPDDRPFLFLHLYEPHIPWEPPAPFDALASHPYDGEIAFADSIFGQMATALRELGLWNESLIIVLSDHGEGLGDHGEMEHGVLLYREALQVPLLVKHPQAVHAGAEIAAPVSLVDVLPTILDAAGLDPPSPADGAVLPAPGEPVEERALLAETQYPTLHLGWSPLRSVILGPNHYIEGRRGELFDLEADPGEQRDLTSERRGVVARVREILAATNVPLNAPAEVDPETRERLTALGYLGSPQLARGDLPDPRDRVGDLEVLQTALRLLDQGDPEGAIPILQDLLTRNPSMRDAREQLALASWRVGDLETAASEYRLVLDQAGGLPEVTLNLAALLVELGELDEARDLAESVESTLPDRSARVIARVDVERADALAREGAAQEARKLLEEVIAAHPDLLLAHSRLAVLLVATGETDAGIDVLRHMTEDLGTPEAYAEAVETLRALGDQRSATGLLRHAQSLFPESEALLRAEAGDP